MLRLLRGNQHILGVLEILHHDQLALLLLVLEARENGRVRLCGGSVDSRRGRAAATVARPLGCTASAGKRVLEHLEDRELVLRARLKTGSGMPNRSRLVVPAVAAAHGHTVADDVREDRAEARKPEFSDPDDAAGPGEAPETETEPQVNGSHVTDEPGVAEPDVAAALHTDHPHLGTEAVDLSLCGGFSGEGRGAVGRRPERACTGEDRAADGEGDVAGIGSPVAERGPLRGEQPKESPVEQDGRRTAGADAGGWPKAAGWEEAQRQRRVDLPADLRLRVALAPVSWLWKRLSGWQQNQVEAAAKTELAHLEGLLALPGGAPRLLADRLTDRLAETGGEAMVTGPYGWLIRRGLVQRPSCTDRRCDNGVRIDTGAACDNCANVLHTRRARRARISTEIDRELPGLADDERRRVLKERLREHTAAEAKDLARRREEAREQQARRAAARAAAAQRAEAKRAAAAVGDAVRQELACEDCGQQRAAGLCEACGYRRRTEALVVEAGLVAATWSADLTDPADVAAVSNHVRDSLVADVATAQGEFMAMVKPSELDQDPAGAASVLAFTALQTVQAALPEYQASALGRLGRTQEAEAEASRAYRTEQKRRWFRHNPHGADAIAAATEAADEARQRIAQYLLASRLKQLREQAPTRTEQTAAVPWMERLPELAARPLDGDATGTVIA